MECVKSRWLLLLSALVTVALATFLFAKHPTRRWHDAEVLSVEQLALFRYFEIIDSHDPSCILKYREWRNPFRPLSISKETIVRVAEGGGPTIYLTDQRGREHRGRLILQGLMPGPPVGQR